MTTELTIAANNGDLGGGEVMLLRIAEAARADDLRVRVVGPAGELIQAATELGFPSVAIASRNRPEYLRGLRRWDRDRRGLLWCNGLVPALAGLVATRHPDVGDAPVRASLNQPAYRFENCPIITAKGDIHQWVIYVLAHSRHCRAAALDQLVDVTVGQMIWHQEHTIDRTADNRLEEVIFHFGHMIGVADDHVVIVAAGHILYGPHHRMIKGI